MTTTKEEKKKRYNTIFRLLNENPRILPSAISKAIGTGPQTASNRLKEAFEKGYIVGPHIRKRSFKNFIEYVYFVNCKDALEQYLKLSKDERISYCAVMDGFANLWVISKEEINIEGDVLVGGPRSDYYMPIAPGHSWEKAIEIKRKKVKNFNLEDYKPKIYIKNRWNETIEWDEEDELLFWYFKYDLRKPMESAAMKYCISGQKSYEWLENLPKACTILTSYFPETISAYEPYIYMFDTDYEDFIIDLYSELPTSCLFFKVSGKLVLLTYIRRNLLRSSDFEAFNANKLQIPLLNRDLTKKGIIRNKERAIVAHHYRKDI